MTIMLAIIMIALKLPKKTKDLIARAQAIVTAMTNNANFSSPLPTLASVSAAIAALVTAENATSGRPPGAVKARNGKQRDLIRLLYHLADYVKQIAEQSPDNYAAIIASASMYTVERKVAPKADFAAFQGAVSGEARLVARAGGGGRATHYWQFSLDQKSWQSVADTDKANTVIAGLTPGQTYYFRHASMRKNLRTDWSQVVSLIVK